MRPDPLDSEIADIEAEIEHLTKSITKDSYSVSAPGAFMSRYFQQTREDLADTYVTSHQVRTQCFRSWSKDYNELTPHEKMQYTEIGKLLSLQKQEGLFETRARCFEVLKTLYDKRMLRFTHWICCMVV